MRFIKRVYSLLKIVKQRLVVTKSDYKDAQAEIRHSNRNMLTVCSFLITMLMLGLFFLSFIKSPWIIRELRMSYISFALYFFLFFILSIIILPKYKKYTTLFVYIFISTMFIFGIYDSITTDRFSDCVIFCVLQVVCPMMFTDRLSRMSIFCLFWALVNSAFTMVYKPMLAQSIDYLHMTCFYFIGMVLHMYLSSIKTREIILQQTISTERDRDSLTGLYNKSALQREIKKNLLKNRSSGILLIFDADNFKSVNDRFGHDVGDEVLENISTVLNRTFRRTDIIGRFGGDEFVIFMTHVTDLEIAETRARQALDEMNKTPVRGDPELFIHGSFGIASVPPLGETYDELFKRADKALYVSKRTGKNRISIDGVSNV